ncbi:MAG: tyrosine-type recombinase/integrase [Coriobacteriales bacterium]|nr:tyrosine-type recombinase/integrase [Coriobacteriales bacterium]
MCCSSTGGRIRIDNFSHWWGIWRKEHGFDGLKFHELRHTQATLLLANGVDVKTVQTRLGHASASITLDWYAHAIPQNDHAAATMLGNLLNSKQGEDEPKDPQENAAQTQEESFRLLPHENLPKVTAKSRQKARREHTKTGQLVQLVS